MSVDDGKRVVRQAIEGAGRAFQVIEGGGKGSSSPPPPPPPARDVPPECPVVALGHFNGMFHFLDVIGQKRELSARQLGSRHELVSLFLGDDTWLRARFPKRVNVKKTIDGAEVEESVIVDFQINRAAAWMQGECARAGMFGDHIVLRRPGVWLDPKSGPVVHCGDQVLIGDTWHPAGTRTDAQIWAAAPPTPRPSTPCEAEVARRLQEDLRHLWNFRLPGSEIAVLGLIGTAYYGAAARWRAGGFIIGGAGSGKSQLLSVIRACCPLHYYTNDTTKAGVEQEVTGRAMPILIDEAGDREDQRTARALLDLVLSASGGEGTKGQRGGIDGKARRVDVVGSIIMATISPPDMKPQHLGRFTLIELVRPEDGADHTQAHERLVARLREEAPALWGRALVGWERYRASLGLFRSALGRAGCQPREMDQLGALLAGWWVLTEEGVPTEAQADGGVSALDPFIRRADDVLQEDAPRRMINHLLSTLVQMDRSTDREQLGTLLQVVLRQQTDARITLEHARRILGNYGMRVITADEQPDKRGRPVPRAAEGNGVWFSLQSAELRKLFAGTPFEGDRWRFEMKRLESAREPKMNVRVSPALPPGRAIWVSAEELGFDPDESLPGL